MTALILSPLLLLRILTVFQTVLTLFQLYLCITAFHQHRTRGFTVLVTAHFLAGLAFYFVLLEGVHPLYLQGNFVSPPAQVTRILALPWLFFTLTELLSAILCLLCAGSGLWYTRSHLSSGAPSICVPPGSAAGKRTALCVWQISGSTSCARPSPAML